MCGSLPIFCFLSTLWEPSYLSPGLRSIILKNILTATQTDVLTDNQSKNLMMQGRTVNSVLDERLRAMPSVLFLRVCFYVIAGGEKSGEKSNVLTSVVKC